jgi:hypothetical protein
MLALLHWIIETTTYLSGTNLIIGLWTFSLCMPNEMLFRCLVGSIWLPLRVSTLPCCKLFYFHKIFMNLFLIVYHMIFFYSLIQVCWRPKPTGELRLATRRAGNNLRAAAGPGPSERRPAKLLVRTSRCWCKGVPPDLYLVRKVMDLLRLVSCMAYT